MKNNQSKAELMEEIKREKKRYFKSGKTITKLPPDKTERKIIIQVKTTELQRILEDW